MKAGVAIAVAAAALAAWLLFRPEPRPPEPARSSTSAPPAPAPPPVVPPAGNDVRLLALGATDAWAQGRIKDVEEAAARLRERLLEEPGLWAEVVDILCSVNHPAAVAGVGGKIAGAMDAAAETRFIGILRSGASPPSRRLAASVLATRESGESLDVLMTAAQRDADRAVRMDALKALALRKDRATSEEGALAIQDLFLRRAQGESDQELRNIAKRLAGQPVPEDVVPPVEPPRRRASVRLKTGDPR